MKETELAEQFISYFGDEYEIFKEVPTTQGIVDFVAINSFRTAIEVKVNLNFDVMEQAFRQKMYFHYCYAAVPEKKNDFSKQICKMLGIGLLECSDFGRIHETVKPAFNRNPWPVHFAEYMKRSVAGSQSNRMTAFKATIELIVKELQWRDGQPLKDLISDVKHHWGSNTTAKNCIYQWCRKGVIKEFRIEGGKIFLNK